MVEKGLTWRKGGCHCGAVRFEVLVANEIEVQACNCSICHMTGYLHFIVRKSRFRLLDGTDRLTTYAFNTETAEAHVLFGMRDQVVLRAAFPSGRIQREFPLHERGRVSLGADDGIRRT